MSRSSEATTVHPTKSTALTLTVQLEGATMAMAISDGRSAGHIASLQVDPALWPSLTQTPNGLSVAVSQAHSATLFGQLFPEKIGQFLRSSPVRELCLQLDEKLLDIPWELAFDGRHYLGEKFQIARRIVSETSPAPAVLVGKHHELLKLLLVLDGDAPHSLYADTLAAQLGAVDALDITQVQLPHTDRATLLRMADAVDIVHYIGTQTDAGTSAVTLADIARQARPSQLLVCDGMADAASLLHPGWLHAACARGTAVLVATGEQHRADAARLAHLASLYRSLALGAALGEAVRQARVHGLDADLWSAALYGDAALVLHPAASHAAGLDDHLRQVTAMSCDLVGSTALLDTWGAERYSEMLDNYHATCTGIVARWGGISDIPQGDDGTMSYFGIPLAYEDSVARAFRAGLEILKAVPAFGVQVRIGVVTGHVVVKAGQPFGVSLHLAARLQSIARPGSLVTNGATRQIVKDKFVFEELQSLPQLKGFALETAAFNVLAEVHSDSSARRDDAPAQTPFVGREAELKQLHAHWDTLPTTGLQTVLVSGEAGMGKSRLIREFRSALNSRNHRTMECRCTPEHTHSAFHPLIDLLRRRLRLQDDESPAAKLERIRTRLPGSDSQDHDLAVIAALLSVPTEGLLLPLKVSAEKQRQHTLDVLGRWLVYETQRGPVCVVVEDLQWIDPSTRAFVQRVVAEAPQLPLMLLLSLRSEHAVLYDPGFAVHELPLKGLSADATRAMILTACGPSAVRGEMVQLLADKADGVPLFIEESARMVMDLGVQAHSVDAALVARFTVPTTIHDLLMARLDRLANAKPVAQVGATIGREFTLALLQAVLAHETSPIGLNHLPAQLATLVRSGLVVEKNDSAGASYYFKHALVRDAAYGSLWERDRKRLHRTIANVVREQFLDLAQSQPELLAHHFMQSGNDAQALEYWERAARRSASRSAHVEAINHVRSGLGLLVRLPPVPERERTELRLQLMLAGQLIATQGYGADQVGHAYERAAELCPRAGDESAQMKTLLGLEGYHFMRADFERAHVIAQQASAMLGDVVDPMRKIQLRWAVGNILFHQGEFHAAVAHLDECLHAYDQLQHHPSMVQDPGVMCLCYSSWAVWEIGNADQALQRAQKAVGLAEQLDHKFSLGEAAAFCASVHLFRGEYLQALQYAQRSRDICQEGGFAVWLAYAQLLHGRLIAELGDPEAGVAEMGHAYEQWVATGAVVTRPLYLAMQAEGLALAGRPDAGLALLKQAYDLVCQTKEHYHEAEVRRLTGELMLQSAQQHGIDRSDEAQQWLHGALYFARTHQHSAAALRAATSLARVWAGQGRTEAAWRLLKKEYDDVTEGFYTRDVLAASALLEQLHQASIPTLA